MNKKTVIIITIFVIVIGFILTGLFGEQGISNGSILATYCEFQVGDIKTTDIDGNEVGYTITTGANGKKYMTLPEVELGEEYIINLIDIILYGAVDEEGNEIAPTYDISEIQVLMETNQPDYVTYHNLLLKFNAIDVALPVAGLSVNIEITTADGSNLKDMLYMVDDPSNIPIEIDPDFQCDYKKGGKEKCQNCVVNYWFLL